MIITRTSAMTGITRTMDLPITPAQFEQWQSGAMIQDALSNLSSDDREFILNGITKEEWDAEFCNPTTAVASLGLTVRTTNCLASIGVITVQDLSECREADLLQVANFHKRCLKEVLDILADYNLTLTA